MRYEDYEDLEGADETQSCDPPYLDPSEIPQAAYEAYIEDREEC